MFVFRDFYEDDALILSEEAVVIGGLLVGLNVIDCNLCVKEEDLDSQVCCPVSVLVALFCISLPFFQQAERDIYGVYHTVLQFLTNNKKVAGIFCFFFFCSIFFSHTFMLIADQLARLTSLIGFTLVKSVSFQCTAWILFTCRSLWEMFL